MTTTSIPIHQVPTRQRPILESGIGVLMVLMALFVLTQYGTSGVLSPDFYLHILHGEWILGHYALPPGDVFSWTASGQPYVVNQWGSEVLMAMAWLLGGGWGTKILTAMVVCAILYVMYRAANIQFDAALAAFATTVLLAGGTLVSTTAQPEMFSYLLFAVTVLITEHWRENCRSGALVWIPPVFLIWANLDGGFLIGLAYLLVMSIGMGTGFALKDRAKCSFARVAPFAAATSVGALATLINPNGIFAWTAAADSVGNMLIGHEYLIKEWMTPTLLDRDGVQLIIAVIMTIAAVGWSRRSIRIEELSAFSIFLCFGFAARAGMPYFMMAIVPILARLGTATRFIDWTYSRIDGRSSLLSQALLIAIALPVVFFSAIVIKQDGERDFSRINSVPALEFLIKSGMTERVMHGFDAGGYYAYSADMKVFVDRRSQLYGRRFLAEYFNAMAGRDGYQAFLAKWEPNAIVVRERSPLKTLLVTEGTYFMAFEGGGDVVLLRRNQGIRQGSRGNAKPRT